MRQSAAGGGGDGSIINRQEQMKLKLKIIEAVLLRDTEAVGRMDPFVVVEHKNNKY